MQHGHAPRLSAVNSVLYTRLKPIEPTFIATDVSHKREASIVSKRVSEMGCGVDAVIEFAEGKVRFMDKVGEPEQRARWIFFRDVDSSAQCDLLETTIPLVSKYKTQLKFRVDVSKSEWRIGPMEDVSRGVINR